MTKPIVRDPIYRKWVFDIDIIVFCARWYLSYRLTFRDLTEIIAECVVSESHRTLLR